MISGLLKAALLEGDAADLVQGGCLGGAVTGAAGGTQRVAEDDECLGVVAASAKVAGGGGGQPGGAAGPAVRSGMHGKPLPARRAVYSGEQRPAGDPVWVDHNALPQ